MNKESMKIGGQYNWRYQLDKLIYLGRLHGWHQFKKIGDSREVWCEVLDADLYHIEETVILDDEPCLIAEAVASAQTAERERCALVCESQTQEYESHTGRPMNLAYQCAEAIRGLQS